MDSAVWLRLVEARELEQPGDVLPVYRRLIDQTLVEAGARNARDAVRLLQKVRRAGAAAGNDTEVRSYLGLLREEHRRRHARLKHGRGRRP